MANETTRIYNCRIRDLPGFSVFDNTRCGLITHTLRVHKTPEYHKEKFQPNLLEINSLGKNSNSKNGCVRKTKDRWILLKTKEKKGKKRKTRKQNAKFGSLTTLQLRFSTQSNLDADSIH